MSMSSPFLRHEHNAQPVQRSFAGFRSLTFHSAGAQAVRVITLAFPNPSGSLTSGQSQRIDSTLSFVYSLEGNIRTLSTNGDSNSNDVTGLLYTPDLAQDDPCFNASLPYVPTNATRRANFPDDEKYSLVALAPWISPTCTLSYLAAARTEETRGFLFFMPTNSTAEPPLANDAYWSVGDGGGWKRDNAYPVYALSGAAGNTLIQATAQYSGDITDLPESQEILATDEIDPSDFVRLYVDIDTGESNSQLHGMSFILHNLISRRKAPELMKFFLFRRSCDAYRNSSAHGYIRSQD
jgi:hypothetical protein